ncbi:MAG: hypothetical protein Q7S85_10095 [Rugosibacter sp.]|nr:hypothetical protein [Rugosibacter sp.]
MDHSYLDIEAHIREANRQRSEAMGKLISAGWSALKQFLAGLQYRRPTTTTVVTNPSALIGFQQHLDLERLP